MYSQHNEDEFILRYIKDNRLKPAEIVVEIGAWDAVERSNSRLFIQRDWEGHLVEPIWKQFQKIHKFYSDSDNVFVLNCAIGAKTGKGCLVTHPTLPDHTHLADIHNENYDYANVKKKGKEISTYMLVDLFKLQGIKEIGILSIDTEGMDSVIAYQLIYSNYRPMFIIIEGNNKKSKERQHKILSKDYSLIATKNVNTIWLKNGI